VRAFALAFNLTTIRARTGATVTVNFRNDDQVVPHDISFPGIIQRPFCNGPCTDSYSFRAPAPGRYTFNCSVHPQDMVGAFIVDP
jgi:plastocyanin